jgi:Raf kinase inhibitor-like YbhB/YbcL family protein
MKKRFYFVLALVLVPLLIFTACNGGGGTTSSTQTTTHLTTTLTSSTPPSTTTTTTTSPTTTTTTTTTTSTPTTTTQIELTETPVDLPVVFEISSTSFADGAEIPQKFGWNGGNRSPQFSWSGAPEGTVTYVLMMEDLDSLAPPEKVVHFCHWLVFNIPVTVCELPEGDPFSLAFADEAIEGMNTYEFLGYGGPWPPAGQTHHYRIRVYALDTALDLTYMAERQDVDREMTGHVLGFAEYFGTFKG